jgi:CRP-like cAMP-binding protein
MIGREGAAGLQNAMGQRPSFTRAIVQVPGVFWSISAEALRRAIENSEQAKAVVNRYTEILWAEAQQLAACNAVHQSLPRLARWLLQSADRTGSNRLPLTQEFLGEMLGVRRTSVTLLAQELQNRGIIRYGRGKITVLDRAALEATACECYQVIEDLYRGWLPL